MITELDVRELQCLWIVGATERLVQFGIMNPDLPLNLKPEAQDTFLELNLQYNLQNLFSSDSEILALFSAMAHAECPEISDQDIQDIATLLIQYKNKPEEVARFALNHQFYKN